MSARNGRRLQQALIYLVLIVASVILVAPVVLGWCRPRS